jgi:hypothetical protein
MNKADMLCEGITQEIIRFLIADNGIEVEDAMNLFYSSALFDKLRDTETGLYLEGSAYVYELLKDELAEIGGLAGR